METNRNKLIVVLGMHRSGTSVIARGMRVLGVHLGNNLMPATQDNPKGYWEDLDINTLNIEMLNFLKNDWHFLTPIQSEDIDVLRRNGYFLRALEIIRKKMAAAPVFGFKDPRVAKLLPFWKEIFAYDQLNTHYILTIRHPLSVCKSLTKRDGFEFEKGYLLWLEHVINSFANTEGESRVVVDYDRLMQSPDIELARIAKEFQLQIDDSELEKFKLEFLDDELRHTVYKINDLTLDEAAPSLVRDVYSKALEIAEDKLRVEDAKFKKSIEQWGTELARQKSAFVLADKLETRIVQYEKSVQTLESQVAEKERTLQSFSNQAVKMDETIKLLTSQVADKELSAQAFSNQAVKMDETIKVLTSVVAEKEQSAQMFSAQVAEKEQAVQILSVQVAEKDRASQALSAQVLNKDHDLEEIRNSRAWILAMLFRRIRVRLIPPNSRRARIVRFLVGPFVKIRANWKLKEDLALIRSSGLFDKDWYLTHNSDIAKAKINPVRHYLQVGGIEGRDPGPNFSSAWYLETYVDVKNARINPLVHYLRSGRQPGRLAQPVQTKENLGMGYPSDLFDPEWYLTSYPDVAQAGVDPYQHYQQNGKFEGRLGRRPNIEIQAGGVQFEPSKDTVLVVSHEASRTGAPILGLNVVQHLQKKYNVVSMLLGDGPIAENFRGDSTFVVGPMPLRGNPFLADLVIEQVSKIYSFKFAIVNSIESRVVLHALAKQSVPAINLVHEFAIYTRPRDAFLEAILWSQETIFSALVTYENAISENPELAEQSFHIIPQGYCVLPIIEGDANSLLKEEPSVLSKLRPEGSPSDAIVILGAGTVQMRKGVDLFIACAARMLRLGQTRNFRFVWIGNGYHPDEDLAYSAYLADQIHRAGLSDHVFFMENTSNIEEAYKAADILLISSRLDPLPNVAIDAMMNSMPVVCFDKTTGVADILMKHELADYCIAPYLDTENMTAKIMAFMESKSLRQDIGERLRQLALKEFNMEHYTAQLEELGLASSFRIGQEQLDASEIARSGLARMDYYQNQQLKVKLKIPNEAFQYYVRTWATGIRRRKLFPGFHPGMFLEQSGMCTAQSDPLATYLRANQPNGPWRYEVLTSEETKQPVVQPEIRIALHMHVYYPDLLPDMLTRLNKNRVRPDLFISLPKELTLREVLGTLKSYLGKVIEIQVVPNRGRDIGPFLTAFGATFVDNYDVVGHLHTKKTASIQDSQMGEDWRLFLLENMLGGKSNMADIILERMVLDPSIGIVFPDDPYIVGWNKNRLYAEELGKQLGLNSLPNNFLFPVGTMFWARVRALTPIFEIGLDWQDYPTEPLPDDGSILHAVERLLPFVVSKQGFRLMLTNVAGITR